MLNKIFPILKDSNLISIVKHAFASNMYKHVFALCKYAFGLCCQ